MHRGAKRIGEILVERRVITESQLKEALQEQASDKGFLGTILVRKGFISKRNLAKVLAEQFSMPFLELNVENTNLEVARRYSSTLIVENKCFPLKEDDETITVAIFDPLNAVTISKIESEAWPRKVNLVLVEEDTIEKLIQKYRQSVSEGIRRLLKKDKESE